MTDAAHPLETIDERPGERPPDLSVLMPLRNSERIVGDAVASVLQQRDCIAEIVISDDQSTDDTLAAARRVVADWRGPHHVGVLRTTRRLAVDHVGALASVATARLLVQAHGDDISLPGRMARLMAIHRDSEPSLITSLAKTMTDAGIIDDSMSAGWSEGLLPLVSFAVQNPRGMLAGARYAIDRRVFEHFPRLDSSYLRSGHDALQAFRAWLLSGVWLCAEPLILRSSGPDQWSRRLWDDRRQASRDFGYSLRRLGVMRAMLRDLAHAREHGMAAADRVERAQHLVTQGIWVVAQKLLDARDELHDRGLVAMWVEEDALERANREPRPPE